MPCSLGRRPIVRLLRALGRLLFLVLVGVGVLLRTPFTRHKMAQPCHIGIP